MEALERIERLGHLCTPCSGSAGAFVAQPYSVDDKYILISQDMIQSLRCSSEHPKLLPQSQEVKLLHVTGKLSEDVVFSLMEQNNNFVLI